MAIGAYGYDVSHGPNPDFERLIACREEVSRLLSLDPSRVQLSMGMTSDFEQAVSLLLSTTDLDKSLHLALERRQHDHTRIARPSD